MPYELHQASKQGRLDHAKRLLRARTPVDDRDNSNQTPLHVASVYNQLDVAQFLLSNGATLDARDKNDWTPLHASCFSGSFEAVEFLLNKGASVNSLSKDGNTPMHYLVRHSTQSKGPLLEKVFDRLARNGGPQLLNKPNFHGETPLHCAALRGNFDGVQLLLRTNPDANVRNKRGSTPLHVAVQSGKVEVVSALIAAGADTSAVSSAGTALDIAQKAGNDQMISILMSVQGIAPQSSTQLPPLAIGNQTFQQQPNTPQQQPPQQSTQPSAPFQPGFPQEGYPPPDSPKNFYQPGGSSQQQGGNANPQQFGNFTPQHPTGNFNPQQTGNFNPQQSGNFNPQQGTNFNLQQGGNFNPQQGGNFNPQQGGNFNPQQGGNFNPQQSGSFNPQQGPHGGNFVPPGPGNWAPQGQGRDSGNWNPNVGGRFSSPQQGYVSNQGNFNQGGFVSNSGPQGTFPTNQLIPPQNQGPNYQKPGYPKPTTNPQGVPNQNGPYYAAGGLNGPPSLGNTGYNSPHPGGVQNGPQGQQRSSYPSTRLPSQQGNYPSNQMPVNPRAQSMYQPAAGETAGQDRSQPTFGTPPQTFNSAPNRVQSTRINQPPTQQPGNMAPNRTSQQPTFGNESGGNVRHGSTGYPRQGGSMYGETPSSGNPRGSYEMPTANRQSRGPEGANPRSQSMYSEGGGMFSQPSGNVRQQPGSGQDEQERQKRIQEQRRAEAERQRRLEEQRKLEEQKRAEEQKRKFEEEKRKEEERKRQEEERKRLEEEKRKAEEIRKAEEEKRRVEEEKRRREDEEKKRQQQLEEQKRRQFEEQKRRQQQFEEQKRRQQQQQAEEQKRRQQQQQLEEQKRRQQQLEEQKRRQQQQQLEEQKIRQAEEQRKTEAEKLRLEEEALDAAFGGIGGTHPPSSSTATVGTEPLASDDFDLDEYLNQLSLETEAVRSHAEERLKTPSQPPATPSPPPNLIASFGKNETESYPPPQQQKPVLIPEIEEEDNKGTEVAEEKLEENVPQDVVIIRRAEKDLSELASWLVQELNRQNPKTSRRLARRLRKKSKGFCVRFGKHPEAANIMKTMHEALSRYDKEVEGASEKLGLYEYMGQEKTKTANKEESDSEEESYGSEDDEPQQTSSGFGGFGYGFNVNAI
eukprot:CAMPEP_0201502698 /NCGR_PEP_ID=MMETSP0151_2-20130828/84271_1 /ASSEMBLY_ACC=CAM_ASM_000257 /TAXON_ID=200890 /ORGANISM="Paramoeba atlantica, Strain 621/1 / CCAP 1560/9" /LENGTH=1132 /DNA_ID=CAMNT_0047896317 /DNA_START=167 /DNA_END=3565 /DNA_ORIENTATION=-